MKKLLVLLLALSMAFSIVACGEKTNPTVPGESQGADPEAAKYGGVLNIAIGTDPGSIDPHYTSGTEFYKYSNNVFENPLAQDAKGNIVANVCEYEMSEDGLTLKLWVRDGVKFHDGSAVEIDDVVASLDRAGKLQRNVSKSFTAYVENVNVADGVATYTFSKFSPSALYNISLYQTIAAVMPKEVCEKYGEEGFTDIADCIGTGPYKLEKYTPGIGYEMVRFDDYVPVEEGFTGEAAPKKAYLDKINVWINQDVTSLYTTLMNGEYDVATVYDADYLGLLSNVGFVKEGGIGVKTCYLAFNTKGTRPVNDVNLRKAIACLADIDELARVEGVNLDYSHDGCPVPAGNQYYTDKFVNAEYVGRNLELAQKYLDASDYNGEEIVILAAKYPDSCVLLESYMREFGLNVKLEYMDQTAAAAYWADNSNPYDIMIAGATMVASYPALIPAALKDTYWGNERKDELFAALNTEPIGSAASLDMWDELTTLWIDDASIVCLYNFGTSIMHPEDLVFENNATYYITFYNMYWKNPSAHAE